MIRAELAALLRLALPIVLTQLSQMGMGVADTVMAGRYSAVDLAGVALGASLFWPTVMLFGGVLMAITPLVSHLHGAGEQARAGEVVRQAGWFALAAATLLIIGFANAGHLYRAFDVDARAIPVAVAYLDAISFGIVPLLGYFALRYLCEGMSWTTPAMVIAFSGFLLKIPLNWLLIHGFTLGPLTVPALGGAGCGWASALVMWAELVVLAVVVARSRLRETGVLAQFSWPDAAELLRILKLGTPIGLTIFLEFSFFSFVALLVGHLGVEAVAAHQIAMNVAGLAFMVPMALGIAVSIRIGFNVGARDLAGARRSGRLAVALAMAVAVLEGGTVLYFQDGIAGLYTEDSSVIALVTRLLLFVAFWQLLDGGQATLVGALRGFKDTRMPMVIAIFSYWLIGLPTGMSLGYGWLELPAFTGLFGFWIGFCVALVAVASILLGRFVWLTGRDERILAFSNR